MRVTLLIILCSILKTVSGQSSADTAQSYVPVIYGERLEGYVDSLKKRVLADTAKFNEADLIYTASGRRNSKSYSKLFIINGSYIYKLDIVSPKEVVEFTKELLDPQKIKSLTVLDSSKTSPLFGPDTWNGIILITMWDKAKFNPKVAGLTLRRKSQGDNFAERKKELVARDVTPCMDCGASEAALQQHLNATYTEYQVYFNQRLVLCNFCAVDFSAYKPEYFGFPSGKRMGLQDFNFVRQITDRSIRVDKYCPQCDKRLAFLKFVDLCRQGNSAAGI